MECPYLTVLINLNLYFQIIRIQDSKQNMLIRTSTAIRKVCDDTKHSSNHLIYFNYQLSQSSNNVQVIGNNVSELVYKLVFDVRHALVKILNFRRMSTNPSGFTVLTGQVGQLPFRSRNTNLNHCCTLFLQSLVIKQRSNEGLKNTQFMKSPSTLNAK